MTDPCDRPKWAETIPTSQLPPVLYTRLEESYESEGKPVPDTLSRKKALQMILEWEGIIGFTNLIINLVIGAAETQALENGKVLNRG